MKIAYISKKNISDINEWSGSANGILKCLNYANFEVELIHNFSLKFEFILKIIELFYRLFKIKYDPDRSIIASKIYAKYIERKLNKKQFDFIISYDSTLISFLNTKIPIILWTDLTFDLYQKTYFRSYKSFNKGCINRGNYLEKKALDKAFKIIYSSTYSKKNAIEIYNIDENKIIILPFSGNIIFNYDKNEITKVIEKRIETKNQKISFLSVGVDWERKGMDDAINFVKKLNKLNLKSEIHIVGSIPKNNNYDERIVKIYGYLSKKKDEELKLLKTLYEKSHYFILLSKEEALGIVFLEAASFGLPIITRNIGGIKSVVKNNGIFFDDNDFEKILAKFKLININENNYKEIANNSLEIYNQSSWKSIASRLREVLINLNYK